MELLKVDDLKPYLNDLIELLCDAVDSGAPIGFLPPMSELEAKSYWLTVNDDLKVNLKQVLLVREDHKIVGSVQIGMSPKANALHRCDVEKLMVHTQAREHGLGSMLMKGVERVAAAMQRQLLILEVRSDDVAHDMYIKLGYVPFGEVPGYTRSANGALHNATFFYKEIEPTHEVFS
ncbi:GNAT family N-acetyltransferase [Marinomonas spartinae]|uniref:GNAT family N-acetyltransferase n=1 Tax=Marinomonas spartinae TaxID=1792290 RepID=UPI0018F1E996|nr:GNAT family N-acetyltransferase [Marinomonas spartinae]MBJ7555620.1 GNAT family N-acetyltransferase [Marinomonas spartinae]